MPCRSADLQRLDILINGESVDALARVVHRDKAQAVGRRLCAKLRVSSNPGCTRCTAVGVAPPAQHAVVLLVPEQLMLQVAPAARAAAETGIGCHLPLRRSTLQDLMDRQQFEVVLQAAAGGRIVARETLRAFRKNVLAKCYGGDISR